MSLRVFAIAAIAFGLASTGIAQSDPAGFASGLRAKFGPPLARETFVARPGLQMVVDYAADGDVCRIQPPSIAPGRDPRVASQQAVDDFIAELLPPALRGKEIRRMASSTGINSVSIVEYENLSIADAFQAGTRSGVTVTFTAAQCADSQAQ